MWVGLMQWAEGLEKSELSWGIRTSVSLWLQHRLLLELSGCSPSPQIFSLPASTVIVWANSLKPIFISIICASHWSAVSRENPVWCKLTIDFLVVSRRHYTHFNAKQTGFWGVYLRWYRVKEGAHWRQTAVVWARNPATTTSHTKRS